MSNWQERVGREIERAQAEADRAKSDQDRLDQQHEADRLAVIEARLPLLEKVWGQWESIDVDGLLNTVNSDIWNNFGDVETKEHKNKDGIVTQRDHVLTAIEKDIVEEREAIYGRGYGHYSTEHWASGRDGGYAITESHFGLHKKKKVRN